ncbi:ATPase, T2SS/T4P/T4SS family, partial [Komagataeibacter rhaeticus]|uniref:ATPase, T2SS/T4P/T4SS family n=2 Tax=Komagataeibacter rhaeticus TaxID=215221 RepID=UPI001A8CB35B
RPRAAMLANRVTPQPPARAVVNDVDLAARWPDPDPPYLVNYQGRDGRKVRNDDNARWLRPAFNQMHRVLKWGGLAVSFYGWNKIDLFAEAWKAAGFRMVGHIVFRKSYASSSGFLRYEHESAYLLAKGNAKQSGQAEYLRRAVAERKNILVAGGTSTGKTTLVNALLAEVAKTGDRVVLIEDTRELQCTAPNLIALRTREGVITLSDLVRSGLRLRPDRIPIGEVRGAEALDLVKAWGTGHPGGIGTLHAGSVLAALYRLEQLIQEAVVTVPRAMIAETIDVIAVLSGRGVARRLSELATVDGIDPGIGAYRIHSIDTDGD